MNCCADIGVPSGCQNVVIIMCWMLRALPSASVTLTFVFRGDGSQTQGIWPHTAQGFGSTGARGSFGSGSIGSPSHSGSLKCRCAFTKS